MRVGGEVTIPLKQAAEILGVHPKTLRNWANEGKISCHRTLGGHRRFKPSVVKALKEELQHPAVGSDDIVFQ